MLSFYEIWPLARERQQAALKEAERGRALKRWTGWVVRNVRGYRDAAVDMAARPEAASIGLMIKGSR